MPLLDPRMFTRVGAKRIIGVRSKTTRYRHPTSFRVDRIDTKIKLKGEILYGHHPVLAAMLAQKRTVHRLFVSENFNETRVLNEALTKGVDVLEVADEVLDYICAKRPHQGVCLDASKLLATPLVEPTDIEGDFVLYLHQINDPMNLGAILRCCAYFGVDSVFVTKMNSCRLSPVVSRASAGAMENVNIYSVSKPVDFFRDLCRQQWTLIGTGIDTNFSDIRNYKPGRKTALLLGSEGSGLPDEILKLCRDVVRIPSSGKSESLDSLNVGVATGILLYHISGFINKNDL